MTVELATFEDMKKYAEVFIESGFFKDIKDVAQAIVKIQAGKEMGFPPIMSMNGIHIMEIEGKHGEKKVAITVGSKLMSDAIKRHPKYDYKVKEHTNLKCTLEFFQDGEYLNEETFTMDDAKRIGVSNKTNWQRYPKNMLFARAMSNGIKFHCPDALGGPVYHPDELGAVTDEDDNIINITDTVTVKDVEVVETVSGEKKPVVNTPQTPAKKRSFLMAIANNKNHERHEELMNILHGRSLDVGSSFDDDAVCTLYDMIVASDGIE